jgi:hypothetical protein
LKEYFLLRLRHSHFLFVAAWFDPSSSPSSLSPSLSISVLVARRFYFAQFGERLPSIEEAIVSLDEPRDDLVESFQCLPSSRWGDLNLLQAILEALKTERFGMTLLSWSNIGSQNYLFVMFIPVGGFGILWSCFFVKWSFPRIPVLVFLLHWCLLSHLRCSIVCPPPSPPLPSLFPSLFDFSLSHFSGSRILILILVYMKVG